MTTVPEQLLHDGQTPTALEMAAPEQRSPSD
jgi:hypothetical protein